MFYYPIDDTDYIPTYLFPDISQMSVSVSVDDYKKLSMDYYNLSKPQNLSELPFSKFSSKYTILESINILIDKIQGSYILGFKIILVVFFYI